MNKLVQALGRVLLALCLLLGGCVDLFQHITVHADGSVHLLWRLGLDADIAGRTRSSERDTAFFDEVARLGGDRVTTGVVEREGVRWYEVEATMPDVATYNAWRGMFIARYGERYQRDDAHLYPARIDEHARWLDVKADVDANPDLAAVKATAHRWELRVTLPTVDATNAPTTQEETAIWSLPTTQVARDGVHAWARWRRSGTPWWWWWTALGLVAIVAGSLVAIRFRRRGTPS